MTLPPSPSGDPGPESSRWSEVERLLDAALDLAPDERAAFLEAMCGGDEELREEVVDLLARLEHIEHFLEATSVVPFFLDREDASAPGRGSSERVRLETGDRVGPYLIVRLLGSGGMGTVYLARDPRLDRRVALKLMPSWTAGDELTARHVTREARAASGLDHPNVQTVYEIGETECGQPYIAFAYYDGQTLRERLAEGPLPVNDAAVLASQLAEGLAAAHARDIVHRDIKPANVVVTPEGVAKILDFGVADEAGRGSTLSRPAGTLAYMSPEQLAGRSVDGRSDLWSLGVVLYEMLTGVRPFRGGDDGQLMRRILQSEPEPVAARRPETPEWLARSVERLLRKGPGDRYPDADRLSADLGRATPSPGAAPAPAGAARRSRGLRPVVAGALLTALAAVVLWPSRARDHAPASITAQAESASIAAHELYLRGSDQSFFRSDAGVHRSVRILQQAVALDPTYATAHAGLAVRYVILSGKDDPGIPRRHLEALAVDFAERAVALDDSLAEAHAALGLVRQYIDFDLARAESELLLAIALDSARSRYHQWLGQLYIQMGRTREALESTTRAAELDPLSPAAHAEVAHSLVANGRHEEALARLRRLEGLQPPLLRSSAYAAQAFAGTGKWTEAVTALRSQAETGESRTLGLYGYLLARSGQRDSALRVGESLISRWRKGESLAFGVAAVYAGLREFDRTFEWLERAAEDGSALRGSLHVMSPVFEEVREDPRFRSLRPRLGIAATPEALTPSEGYGDRPLF